MLLAWRRGRNGLRFPQHREVLSIGNGREPESHPLPKGDQPTLRRLDHSPPKMNPSIAMFSDHPAHKLDTRGYARRPHPCRRFHRDEMDVGLAVQALNSRIRSEGEAPAEKLLANVDGEPIRP